VETGTFAWGLFSPQAKDQQVGWLKYGPDKVAACAFMKAPPTSTMAKANAKINFLLIFNSFFPIQSILSLNSQ
jgi:hypothetical protein